jgi:hypothetical protein
MRRCVFLFLFLLPVLACATPVTLEGSYVTALEDAPEIVPSGYTSVDVPTGILGSCLVLFDLFVSPAGGAYLYASDQTYYHTLAGVTLDLLDNTGNSMGNISLRGSSTGIGAAAFNLEESILVDTAPTAFDLFFEGRDAQIDWTVTLIPATASQMSVRSAPAIPEPMTLMTLAAGSGFLAYRKRLAAV